MREHHDGRAAFQGFQIALEPFQLFRAEQSEPAGFEIDHVHEADEVHAAVVEAVPAVAPRALAVAFEVSRAIFVQEIVLPGDEEHPVGPDLPRDLIERVELLRLRQMGQVAGVDDEVGRHRQRIDAGDRLAERRHTSVFASLLKPM